VFARFLVSSSCSSLIHRSITLWTLTRPLSCSCED
jgi:hypothetical protein